MKKRSKKGFTLAELLIVIAIIAILVAIMFPVFGAQLDKARAAAELSNVRAAYSEAVANALLGGTEKNLMVDGVDSSVTLKKTDFTNALQYDSTEVTVTINSGDKGSVKVDYKGYYGEFEIDEDVKVDSTITSGVSFTK